MKKKFRKKVERGFTLAEVLITLSILGVVAILSVPLIVSRIKDTVTITKVKRTYAILDSALREMYAIEGCPNTWTWPSTDNVLSNNQFFASKLRQYLNVQNTTATFYGSTYKNLLDNASSIPGQHSISDDIVLKDGTAIAFYIPKRRGYSTGWCSAATEKYCRQDMGFIMIDINGVKGPNRLGYDAFFLQLGVEGIITNYFYNGMAVDSKFCNRTSSNVWNGRSCAYWIIHHNNLDYKYRDVSSNW